MVKTIYDCFLEVAKKTSKDVLSYAKQLLDKERVGRAQTNILKCSSLFMISEI